MTLHLLASRYGTDPETVLTWSPRRLGLALECLDAAQALSDRRVSEINGAGGIVWPAVVLGSL